MHGSTEERICPVCQARSISPKALRKHGFSVCRSCRSRIKPAFAVDFLFGLGVGFAISGALSNGEAEWSTPLLLITSIYVVFQNWISALFFPLKASKDE